MPSCCHWLRRSRRSIAKNKKHESRREFSNNAGAVAHEYEREPEEYAATPLSHSPVPKDDAIKCDTPTKTIESSPIEECLEHSHRLAPACEHLPIEKTTTNESLPVPELCKNNSSTTCTTTSPSHQGSNDVYHRNTSQGGRHRTCPGTKPCDDPKSPESSSYPQSPTTPLSISINDIELDHGATGGHRGPSTATTTIERKKKFTLSLSPSFSMSSPLSSKRSIRKSASLGAYDDKRGGPGISIASSGVSPFSLTPNAGGGGGLNITSSQAQAMKEPSSPSVSLRELNRIRSGESHASGKYSHGSDDDRENASYSREYKKPVINGLPGLEDRYLRAVSLVSKPEDWIEVSAFRKYKVKAYYHHVGGEATAHLWMAIEIDQPINRTMCLGNELDLWPKWNKVVTLNEPLAPLTTYNTQNRWLRSIAHGLYKTETLMDLRRFVNHDHGFYLEHIYPIDKKNPNWKEPERGYYREEMESALVLMPINEGKSTLWISYTQAQFPVPINRWFGRIIIPTVCREIASQVLHGCDMIGTHQGKIWRDRIIEDKLNIYSELMELPPQPYSIDNLPKGLERMWSQI